MCYLFIDLFGNRINQNFVIDTERNRIISFFKGVWSYMDNKEIFAERREIKTLSGEVKLRRTLLFNTYAKIIEVKEKSLC